MFTIATHSEDPVRTVLASMQFTYPFELFHLFLSLQVPKLLQEGKVGGKRTWLKEVEQTEELIHAVLERGTRQQNAVLLW